jgi:hypothetical protein
MKGVVFSTHARHQLKERRILPKEVRETLRNPDKIIQQPANRFQALKLFQKSGKVYLLIVVYEKKGNSVEVITAFITSKVRKYL